MATPITLYNVVSTKKITNTNYSYAPVAGVKNFSQVSIVLKSGTATFAGAAIFGGSTDALDLTIDQPVNLSAANNIEIGGFEIVCTTGVINIIGTFVNPK
jgi:hypothetical protein